MNCGRENEKCVQEQPIGGKRLSFSLLSSALISRFVISQRKVTRLALLNGKIFRAGMNLEMIKSLKIREPTCYDLIANLFSS